MQPNNSVAGKHARISGDRRFNHLTPIHPLHANLTNDCLNAAAAMATTRDIRQQFGELPENPGMSRFSPIG